MSLNQEGRTYPCSCLMGMEELAKATSLRPFAPSPQQQKTRFGMVGEIGNGICMAEQTPDRDGVADIADRETNDFRWEASHRTQRQEVFILGDQHKSMVRRIGPQQFIPCTAQP